jgi:hypothetical protein
LRRLDLVFFFCSHEPREDGHGLLCGSALFLIEGGLAPGEAVECPNGAAAIRRAQAMAFNKENAGAVAFSRSGDSNLGEFEDAVILKTFGQVLEDFEETQIA